MITDLSFLATELEKMAWSKSRWLDDFSSGPRKRPDMEIETKRRELAVLKAAARLCRSAAAEGKARDRAPATVRRPAGAAGGKAADARREADQ
jgi:hypothetical protein